MTYQAASPSDCPCGCGQEVPVSATGVWIKSEPYWSWICHNRRCEWVGKEFLNQSGDSVCSMCGEDREFVEHFQSMGAGKQRITVKGKRWNGAKNRHRLKRRTAA